MSHQWRICWIRAQPAISCWPAVQNVQFRQCTDFLAYIWQTPQGSHIFPCWADMLIIVSGRTRFYTTHVSPAALLHSQLSECWFMWFCEVLSNGLKCLTGCNWLWPLKSAFSPQFSSLVNSEKKRKKDIWLEPRLFSKTVTLNKNKINGFQ